MIDFLKSPTVSMPKQDNTVSDPNKNGYVNIISDNVKLSSPAHHNFEQDDIIKALIEIQSQLYSFSMSSGYLAPFI